jgi:hypothetical protein
MQAATEFFEYEYIGPALHSPTREVFKFTLNPQPQGDKRLLEAEVVHGNGGATIAWQAFENRRIKEVEYILGYAMVPGSLNLNCEQNFDWNYGYYRAQILDPRLTGDWEPRWCRFYPVIYKGMNVFAFRFEDERYAENFVELIADRRLHAD